MPTNYPIGVEEVVTSGTLAVVEKSSIWRVQADSSGSIDIFVEKITEVGGQEVTRVKNISISRPLNGVTELEEITLGGNQVKLQTVFRALEKFARKWYVEDNA